jgi:hypothetical protein
MNPIKGMGGDVKLYNAKDDEHETLRTPTHWKYLEINTAGRANLWVPAAGKTIRLMGCCVSFGGSTLGAAGRAMVSFYDDVTRIVAFSTGLNTTVVQAPFFFVNFPGNGYLMHDLDWILETDLTTNLAAGQISVSCWGTEE